MFRFKQFTIQQDRTAMKVCTDACALGALAQVGEGPQRLLDIGTGTGLLALMAAQRNPTARIDAVELDADAAQQATENVLASPFADRVRVFHQRIQDFTSPDRYDRILTNPPFYTAHLRSPDAGVNRALHDDELPTAALLNAVVRLLSPDGQWWVLLPPPETDRLLALAEQQGLHPVRQWRLHHQAHRPAFRCITGFTFGKAGLTPLTSEQLSIYKAEGKTYTTAFRALLRDFYLIF